MLDDMPVPWCLSRRRHYLPEPQGGIVFHTHEYCVAIGGLPVRYRTFMPTSRVYVRVFHGPCHAIRYVLRFHTRCRRLSFKPLKSQELKHRRLVCRSYWAFEHTRLNFVEASVRVPSASDLSSRRAR